jgi:tryptophan synthase alpha chain
MALSFTRRPSLIAYVTCGDPDLTTTREIVLAAIEAGAENIELGVPFSDPVADGPIIQRASERALRRGTTLANVLELAAQVREKSPAGLILFSYLNPVLRLGFSSFCPAARVAGVDGVLLTDLPVEEAGGYRQEARKHDLATVFLAAPTSPAARLRQIARASTGFVYAVSRTGVTGTRDSVPDETRDLVRGLRQYSQLPIAVGFGVSTPAQFDALGKFADAAVVGSAIVEIIERNAGREPQAVAEFIRTLLDNGKKESRAADPC